MHYQESRIIALSCLGHFITHYNLLVFPSMVLPLTRELNLSLSSVLEISFLQFFLFGTSALPWGIAGDKFGSKPLMLIMYIGCALSALSAAIFVTSPDGLYFALAGLGLFTGVYHPIGMGMISKGVSRLNIANGYNAMFGGLGMVVSPLTTGLIIWLWNPATAYIFTALLNSIGLLCILCIPFQDKRSEHYTKSKFVQKDVTAFIILLIAMTLAGIAFTGSTLILPTYLELKGGGILAAVRAHFPIDLSGNLIATISTSIVFIVGMVGQYYGGLWGERKAPQTVYLIFHIICLPTAFIIAALSDIPLIVMCFVYFFFLLGSQPMENTLVAKLNPKHFHHTAFGLKFIMNFGIGSVAVKLMAIVNQSFGNDYLFIVLGLFSLLTVCACIFLVYLMKLRTTERYGVCCETSK